MNSIPFAGQWHPAFEEYFEAIFELREDDLEVRNLLLDQRPLVHAPRAFEQQHRVAIAQNRRNRVVDGQGLAGDHPGDAHPPGPGPIGETAGLLDVISHRLLFESERGEVMRLARRFEQANPS